jgi:predicted lipoprotein with Yx(FWY)xxD motif
MKKNIAFLAPVALILVLYTSCKKNNAVSTPPRTDIHLDSNAAVGTHIVDKDGRTLYFFSNDVNGGLSNCTGGCLTSFPMFNADSATTTFSDGLLASDFKTITLTSGAKQTTYKGWPLYYFAQSGTPEPAGQTNGEGIGNIWFVAKTNYSIMIANNQLIGADGIHYLSTYAPGDGLTNYFCDGNGNTLYTFARDSAFINKFTKADFSNNTVFPIYETGNITVPSTLNKSLFVVTPFNGRNQLTYNGWPLYYFGADSLVRGSTKAVSFPPSQPPGAIWPVAIKGELPAPR